ncbi:MAG: 50S ribosomal protein L6 [Nanoarchaeota archaeon]|nr:50S ribosomal protein L6 [Nanoarchaeota archaeon]
MAKTRIEEKLKIPADIQINVEGRLIRAKGKKGSLEKTWVDNKIKAKQQDNELIFYADEKPTKREKTNINTLRAHVRNMIKGVNEGYLYKLKICSGHFPMNVSVSGSEFIVKNFLGEKTPRKIQFQKEVKITVQGQDVLVEGIEKDLVSQTAANIEQLTRRTNFDKRIFQDGIYITQKDAEK